jgi:branched-chain amino acid aminotransferase
MLELVPRLIVDLASSGARHGIGLFETILVRRGRPLRLDLHLRRLAAGATWLGLEAPPPESEITALAEAEGLSSVAEGALRLYALDRHLILSLAPTIPALGPSRAAGTALSLRRSSSSPLCRHKTLSYLENIMLAREAEARGLVDAIALNETGRLSDGGRTSLLAVIEGELLTPPVADGALPGTIRGILVEAGLAQESPLWPADLERAEAACLTNALRLLLPLEAWEGRRLDQDHRLLREASALLEESGGN